MMKAQAEFDQVPPHSEDAERAILGAMLLNPAAAETAFMMLGRVSEEVFWVPAHRLLWEAMADLASRERPIDALLLKEQ
mgnify:CR=1 FL=1